MPLYVGLGVGQQIQAAVQVSKGSDAETVGGMELTLEKLTAGIPHICQLEQVGSWKQRLDVLLSDVNTAGIDVVHQDVEGLRVHSLQDNPGAVPLSEPREHRVEVGGAGSQDNLNSFSSPGICSDIILTNLLGGDLCVLRHQRNVAEQA